MAGSAINWESLAREDAIGPIVSSGRYRLDSPSTVTGSPTFAMAAAGQSATIRVFLPSGQSVETPISVSGTTAAPLVNQVGKPFSQAELALIEIEVTMPYGQNLLTTDEPNGTPSAPFPDAAARDAAMPASLQPERTRCWILNPLSPDGMTEFVVRGGAWKPRAGQIIYAAYGTLLDTTAEAMSIGAWNLNVWTSPVLPSWVVDCAVLSLLVMHDARDPSSTALEASRIGIWKSDSDRGPAASDSFFGHSQSGAFSSGRSYGTVRVAGRISGTEIRGNDGSATGVVLAAFPNRIIGSINGASARICHDFYPGATTNLDKLFAVELRVEG